MFCIGCALRLYAQPICDAEAGTLMPSATFSAIHCGRGANEPLLLSNNSTNADYQSIFILTNADSIVQKINPYTDSQFDLDNFPAGEYRIFSLNLPIVSIRSLNEWAASVVGVDIAAIQTWLDAHAICSDWCDVAIGFWRYDPIDANLMFECMGSSNEEVMVTIAPSGGLPAINDTAHYDMNGSITWSLLYGDTIDVTMPGFTYCYFLITDDNGCSYMEEGTLRTVSSERKYHNCPVYLYPLITERFCSEHVIGVIPNTKAGENIVNNTFIDHDLFDMGIASTSSYFDLDTISLSYGQHYFKVLNGLDNNDDGWVDDFIEENIFDFNNVSFKYYGNYVPVIDWLVISDTSFQLRVSATGGSGEYEVRGNVWNDWQLGQGDTLLSPVFEQGRYCYVEIIDRVYGCSLVLDSTSIEQSWEVVPNGIETSGVVSLRNYRVYPNPANDRLFVEQEQAATTFLELYNTYGCLLQTWQLSESKESISIANYPTGLYLVRLRNGEGQQEVMPFVITK